MTEIWVELWETPRGFQVSFTEAKGGRPRGGWRALGPKFTGDSKLIKRAVLTANDLTTLENMIATARETA